jgi:hypothetical protein
LQIGNKLSWIYPPIPGLAEGTELPTAWRRLPFLALPDSAHKTEEDSVIFQLPPLDEAKAREGPVFGVACFKQVKSTGSKRGYVQRSVGVISRLPLFGFLRTKLLLVTRVYFQLNGNFERTDGNGETDRSSAGEAVGTALESTATPGNDDGTKDSLDMLVDVFNTIHKGIAESTSAASIADPKNFHELLTLNLSPRFLVRKFKGGLLQMIKLVLLEAKLLFVGSPTQTVCASILSLCSLFPGQLAALCPPHLAFAVKAAMWAKEASAEASSRNAEFADR